MKIRDCTLPSLALGGALLILLPTYGVSYSVLGGDLNLGQRDFRIYDNFSDPEAHTNQQEHPNYPGATGATLAIWKGVVEWGSTRRGNGQGDPSQVGDLGSGGANFDSSWQGNTFSAGSQNSNIISELPGFGGSILAYTEIPISDGWRIFYYEEPTVWHDAPGTAVGPGDNDFDIQGIAVHEYGHALGLGHSSYPASMSTHTNNKGVDLRSIELDDQMGIRRIYGARKPWKPHIDRYELDGLGNVLLYGRRFDEFDNRVWFTRAVPNPNVDDGTPIMALAIPSTDHRTRMIVPIPAGAGPGEILVETPGGTHVDLSNALAFHPERDPCHDPESYGTPKTSSTGSIPSLYVAGMPSASTNDLRIGTYGGVDQNIAVLFSGRHPAASPFRGGTLYVRPPFRREGLQGFFFGTTEFNINVDPSMIGRTRYYQLWFQDPTASFGIGLSDGVEITFCH